MRATQRNTQVVRAAKVVQGRARGESEPARAEVYPLHQLLKKKCRMCAEVVPTNNGHVYRGEFYCDLCIWRLAESGEFYCG